MHVDIEPTQIGRVFAPDYGIVSDAKAALELFVEVARERYAERPAPRLRRRGPKSCQERKANAAAQDQLRQRPDQAAAGLPGDEQGVRTRDTRYVSTIGLSQIQAAQLLHVYKPRHWINAGQAGPARAGPCPPRSGSPPPTRTPPSSRCRVTTTSSS